LKNNVLSFEQEDYVIESGLESWRNKKEVERNE